MFLQQKQKFEKEQQKFVTTIIGMFITKRIVDQKKQQLILYGKYHKIKTLKS